VGHRHSLLRRLTASAENLDADELRDEIGVHSCMPVSQIQRGNTVKIVGRLRAVVYTPSETVPTLQAELFDGSDSIDLVWLGRRRIAGVEPGRRIIARGRVGLHNGKLAIYNPWYELVAPAPA
jgi:RecJ-like exonuclease